MAKYKPFIVRPILSAHCEKCGRIFVRCHPKDTQTLCEYCRPKPGDINEDGHEIEQDGGITWES